VKEAGSPPGTRIEVRRLFFNVPARRKFLRADQTELAHIRQMFIVYALAHPEVGWRLVVDGREMLRMAAGATLADRLRDIVGAELSRLLRPLELTRHDVTVRGYAGLPSAARQDRTEQYIFVNGRPASAPAIFHAINEGYHTLMPPGRYAPIFLFIEVDPEQVDVNVHPTKKEVRFRQPGAIRDAVIEAIRQALQTSPATGIASSLLTMPPPAANVLFPRTPDAALDTAQRSNGVPRCAADRKRAGTGTEKGNRLAVALVPRTRAGRRTLCGFGNRGRAGADGPSRGP
jgi:DNA mismatch repair protein MutL